MYITLKRISLVNDQPEIDGLLKKQIVINFTELTKKSIFCQYQDRKVEVAKIIKENENYKIELVEHVAYKKIFFNETDDQEMQQVNSTVLILQDNMVIQFGYNAALRYKVIFEKDKND